MKEKKFRIQKTDFYEMLQAVAVNKTKVKSEISFKVNTKNTTLEFIISSISEIMHLEIKGLVKGSDHNSIKNHRKQNTYLTVTEFKNTDLELLQVSEFIEYAFKIMWRSSLGWITEVNFVNVENTFFKP